MDEANGHAVVEAGHEELGHEPVRGPPTIVAVLSAFVVAMLAGCEAVEPTSPTPMVQPETPPLLPPAPTPTITPAPELKPPCLPEISTRSLTLTRYYRRL